MKKELKGPKVEDVSVAVVQELGEDNVVVYNVYLINEKEETLEQVLVTSKGYATRNENDEKVETTTLRKMFAAIPPYSAQMIEPIMEDVMGLNNEYWVCFWLGTTMYDKKFIFLSETVNEDNLVYIPILNSRGIVVK